VIASDLGHRWCAWGQAKAGIEGIEQAYLRVLGKRQRSRYAQETEKKRGSFSDIASVNPEGLKTREVSSQKNRKGYRLLGKKKPQIWK